MCFDRRKVSESPDLIGKPRCSRPGTCPRKHVECGVFFAVFVRAPWRPDCEVRGKHAVISDRPHEQKWLVPIDPIDPRST
eukprot:15442415-Alexandrium_andersonii.AAC.1